MSYRFARRLGQMQPSFIREILKVTARPEVISFAGGLPAPELFPVDEVRAACDRVLREQGAQALQYGESEGYAPLRDFLVAEMARRGVQCQVENTLITSGSQQALDLVARVFLDAGDVVLTENPTYMAAIQAFQSYEARFVPVPTDEDGIIPDALPELIAQHHPKLLYSIPTFQNPTGITLTAPRRKALYRVAAEHGLLVVEDDPYGRLRYQGEDIPVVKSLDTEGLVIYLSTFSKIIAPGLRVGWVVADPEIIRRLVISKQAADLHTSSLDQRVAHEYMQGSNTTAHVARIRAAYGERYQVMDESLQAALGNDGFRWTHPEGGMFLWVTCPEQMRTLDLVDEAVARKVLFVPGRDFFPDGSGHRYMRLNFSNSKPERIREGVARLGALCRECAGA